MQPIDATIIKTALDANSRFVLAVGTPLGVARGVSIPVGTELPILFSGIDKKGIRWIDCAFNRSIIRVYSNSAHQIYDTWTADQSDTSPTPATVEGVPQEEGLLSDS